MGFSGSDEVKQKSPVVKGLSAFSVPLQSALLEERQKLERDMAQTLPTASEKERTTLSLAKVQQQSPFPWPPALPDRLWWVLPMGRRSALPTGV